MNLKQKIEAQRAKLTESFAKGYQHGLKTYGEPAIYAESNNIYEAEWQKGVRSGLTLAECATTSAENDYSEATETGDEPAEFDWSAKVMPDEQLIELTAGERADYNRIYAAEWNRLRLRVREYTVSVGNITQLVLANSPQQARNKLAREAGYDDELDMVRQLQEASKIQVLG